MAIDWANLLSEIRVSLKDTSANPKWSDAILYMYAKDAVRDYSRYYPVRNRTQLTLSTDRYPLPSDFIIDYTVEYSEGNYLERRNRAPGRRYVELGYPTLYYVTGTDLYLNTGSPSEDVFLTYGAAHALPTSETDTTHVFTIRDMDIELIRLYVKAKAHEQVRGQQAGLDRFKLGAGSRDDNPLEPEVRNLMDEYYAKIADRFPGGYIKLYRPGRRR